MVNMTAISQEAAGRMTLSGFRKAGHPPTRLSAFFYFDVSFMVWVMLGPLMPFLRDSLKLNPGEMGFLIALPLLAGSFFRPVLGALADRWGGRSSGILGLCLTLLPLLYGWQLASTYANFCCVAIMLGIAGASFAVALPLAGAWYPPEYQGLAMGIAGAGNSGTLVATLFAPRLAQALGWHQVFALALIPVSLVLAFFVFAAKDSPKRPKAVTASQYAAIFKDADAGWFCVLYALTFGSFVGFASFLTVFFHDQYGLTRVQAGDFTAPHLPSSLEASSVRQRSRLADRFTKAGYRLLLAGTRHSRRQDGRASSGDNPALLDSDSREEDNEEKTRGVNVSTQINKSACSVSDTWERCLAKASEKNRQDERRENA